MKFLSHILIVAALIAAVSSLAGCRGLYLEIPRDLPGNGRPEVQPAFACEDDANSTP